MKSYKEILFKQVEGHGLYLDIYMPEDVQNPPLIMWIHGGGWAMLNRNWNLVMPMLDRGYALSLIHISGDTVPPHNCGTLPLELGCREYWFSERSPAR